MELIVLFSIPFEAIDAFFSPLKAVASY